MFLAVKISLSTHHFGELNHLRSLFGIDMGWSGGQVDPFIFPDNGSVSSSRRTTCAWVPSLSFVCYTSVSSLQVQTSSKSWPPGSQAHTATSQASESCKNVLEQILQVPKGACSPLGAGACVFCSHSTVVLM